MIRTYIKGFYNSIVKNKGIIPLTLDDVKKHLRVDEDYTTDDDMINDIIEDAFDLAENFIGADIIPTENTLAVFEFGGKTLYVEDGNYLSGLTITGSTSDFDVYEYINGFRIEFDNWININASVYLDTDMNLLLHYYTGYTTLPRGIRRAILAKIADLYDMETNSYITGTYRNNNVFENNLAYYKKY